jgi:hypothetical protein
VIPTLLLVGLVFGRWWRVVVPVATVGWVVWLVADGFGSGLEFAVEAGALALVNVAVGVLVYQAGAVVVDRLSRRAKG